MKTHKIEGIGHPVHGPDHGLARHLHRHLLLTAQLDQVAVATLDNEQIR